MQLETKAKLSNLRMAPRKVRLVVDSVRGLEVAKARKILSSSKKHAARPVLKLIESAVANAKHNHKAKEASLVISTAFVDEGKTLHRWMPRAMGRATPLRMRASHITVILTGESEDEGDNKEIENEDKEEKLTAETTTKKTVTKSTKKKSVTKTTTKKKAVKKEKTK